MSDGSGLPSATKVGDFYVGPYLAEVWVYRDPIDETDPDGLCMLGVRPRRICIHERCRGQERKAVFVHELTHLALSLFTININDAVEERICEALSFALTEALIDFPLEAFDEPA